MIDKNMLPRDRVEAVAYTLWYLDYIRFIGGEPNISWHAFADSIKDQWRNRALTVLDTLDAVAEVA